MQIDWTTFILQIVNFVVLVWLLKRFLYRPVLDAIARRRTAIEQALGEARAAEDRAAGLRGDYEKKIAAWNQESADQRTRLAEELAAGPPAEGVHRSRVSHGQSLPRQST